MNMIILLMLTNTALFIHAAHDFGSQLTRRAQHIASPEREFDELARENAKKSAYCMCKVPNLPGVMSPGYDETMETLFPEQGPWNEFENPVKSWCVHMHKKGYSACTCYAVPCLLCGLCTGIATVPTASAFLCCPTICGLNTATKALLASLSIMSVKCMSGCLVSAGCCHVVHRTTLDMLSNLKYWDQDEDNIFAPINAEEMQEVR